MKLLIALTGLFCGLFIGTGVLLFNPLSPPAMDSGNAGITYQLSPLEFHGAELDHVALLGLPGTPAGTPFAADNIATANASVTVLRAPGGEAVALATRLAAADKQSRLLRGDVGVNTYTNLFFPNRGSVFMHGRENRLPIIRSGVLRSMGQPGELLWSVTSRLNSGANSGMVGGSGFYESTSGRYSERLQVGPASDGTFTSELTLDLAKP